MVETKKVIKAGLGYIIGGLLIKGISFITTPIFTRLLTPEQFGILNSYLSFESILAMIIGFQFASSLKSSKIEFKTKENVDEYYSRLLFQVLINFLIVIVICNIFSFYFLKLFRLETIFLLNILIANGCGTAIITIYNSKVSLFYEYKKYLLIGIANSLLNVGLSLLMIFTIMNENRSQARILGYAIPCIVLSLIIVFKSFRNASPFTKGKCYTSFSYKYCIPLLVYGFADVMLGQFGKLTVEKYCGESTMGIYSLAFNVYSIMGIIRLALDYTVGPFYFDLRREEKFETLNKITSIYNRALCYISLLIMLFTPEIIRILGTNDYYDARFSAVFLVCASYFVFLISSVIQELYYLKKTYWISIISFVTMSINIFLNYILVPKYGVFGAAITTLTSYMIMVLLYLLVNKARYKCKSFSSLNLIFVIAISTLGSFVSYFIIDMFLLRLIAIITIVLIFVFEFRNLYKSIKRSKQAQ